MNFTINYVWLRQPFHWHAHDFVGLFLIFNSTQPAFNAATTNTERKTVPISLITKKLHDRITEYQQKPQTRVREYI